VLLLTLVNALNLLPLVPLDGRRLLDLLFCFGRPVVSAVFRVVTVAGLGGLAWLFGSWALGLLAVLMFLGIPVRYQQAQQEAAFRDNPLDLPDRLEDLDEEQRLLLVKQAAVLHPLARTPLVLAGQARTLHEQIVTERAGLASTAGLLLMHLAGFAVGLASVFFLIQATQAHNRQAAEQLVARFDEVTMTRVRLMGKAAQLRWEAVLQPKGAGKEAELRARAAELGAEAERQWQELVSEWRSAPPHVWSLAMEQLTRTVLSEGARREEMLRLFRDLGLLPAPAPAPGQAGQES
jgi:hypothetical protein